MRFRSGWLGLLALVACAPGARGQAPGSTENVVPPGYGTLNQDQIAITMRTDDLEIRFIPLEEELLRLLAPDGYASLHQLVESRRSQIDSASARSGVSSPGILMVSFFGQNPGARYDPQQVNLYIRSQLYRAFHIVPFTTNFDSYQVDVRERAIALFLFEEPIPVFEGFQVAYDGRISDAWLGRISQLQRERTRAQGRAQAADRDTAPQP